MNILTRCLLTAIAAVCMAAATAVDSQAAGTAEQPSKPQTTYTKADSTLVVNLLADAGRQPAGTNLTLYFARRLKGTPYVAHTLDGYAEERLVVNLRQLDCLTYVENVTALTLCARQGRRTFADFCDALRRLRYRKDCATSYEARLHYFSDWIDDNASKGVCTEVQAPNPPFKAVQTVNVNYMSTHPSKYAMLKGRPQRIKAIAEAERRLSGTRRRYIPKAAVDNSALLRSTVEDGDIIALTTTLAGLDIQHVGFAVWHADGLHLLNASSLRHKVVEEPKTLRRYLQGQPTMTGMRIIRLK